MPDGEPRSYLYDAFISYRHVEPDRGWAKWLHGALETYRMPRRLVREKGLAPRLRRVFRDEDEVPASAHLGKEIESALQSSKFLIVVCSPRTPESAWVGREIERFRELGRGDQILALLIEGSPTEAFPRALREIRHRLSSHDTARHQSVEEVEPLAADVRSTRGESRRWLRHRARLRLLAALMGCRFDDLMRRDEERRRRALLARTLALAALVIILGALAAYALTQRSSADSQRRLAIREASVARSAEYFAQINLAESLISQGLYSQAWAVLERTAPAMRRFEFDHLRTLTDPTVTRWHVGEAVLDTYDASEDGRPEHYVTRVGLRSADGSLLPWPRPVAQGGFCGDGSHCWGLFQGDSVWSERTALYVIDIRAREVVSPQLPPDQWISAVGGCLSRGRLAVFASIRERSTLFEYDLFSRSVSGSVAWEAQGWTDEIQPGNEERTWLLVPSPMGTIGAPDHPRVVDFEGDLVLPYDAGESPGARHVAALPHRRAVFGVDMAIGMYVPTEGGDFPYRQVVFERLAYRVRGIRSTPLGGMTALWDEGDNLRWYRIGSEDSPPKVVLTLGCAGPITSVSFSRSGSWTFVGDERGNVFAIPHRHWAADANAVDTPQGAQFTLAGAAWNFGWAGHISIQETPPAIELVQMVLLNSGESWTTTVSRWMLADGMWSGDPTVRLPSDDLLFRYSGTERGGEDLDMFVHVPARLVLPIWVPGERRVVHVDCGGDVTGFAVSGTGRRLAVQRGRLVEVGSVERHSPEKVRLVLSDGEVLAGLDDIGTWMATWHAKASRISILELADDSPRIQLNIRSDGFSRRGHGVTFSPAGDRFGCWLDASTIGVFDTRTGTRVLALRTTATYPGGDVRFSTDGSLLWTKESERLSSLGRDTRAVVWATATPLQMAWRSRHAR